MMAISSILKVARVSTEAIHKNSVEAREEAAKEEKTVTMPGSYLSWMELKKNKEDENM
jgi:hypothetical protein